MHGNSLTCRPTDPGVLPPKAPGDFVDEHLLRHKSRPIDPDLRFAF